MMVLVALACFAIGAALGYRWRLVHERREQDTRERVVDALAGTSASEQLARDLEEQALHFAKWGHTGHSAMLLQQARDVREHARHLA